MPGPLSHLTVIELAGIGPGPFACMLLADLGATVIRVDRLPGPPSRGGLEDLMRNDGIVDRGRRSIAVNMKDPRGVEAVLKLVKGADVLIEGFRPGVAEKLGLGPEACHARNPRLVYGRMTGWGQSGPLAQAAGHDLNYIALSGALHAMGPADRPPAPPLNLVGDYGGGGMLLVVGVLAAQAEAQRSGQGQVVDAAMTDGAALLMAAQYGLMAKGFWQDRRESNFLDGAAHFYGTYECADGRFVSIGAIEPQFYQQLLALCGIDDPGFQKQWDSGEWPMLRSQLEALFRTRTRDEWCALLEGTDVCFAPVLSMKEAPHHPHNLARGTFVQADGAVQPAPAPRFDRTPTQLPPRAPAVGAHTRALLAQAGYASDGIDALCAAGVVHAAPSP
ncbi:MAG: CoA transferase [Hydrogenophaga sp.]|uniref:CaiB/BaiF CoA transferase family protein n=1 Tax=Hydrogenophaga sp. TaxID=1904254 RepID=UPI00168EA1F9|nr:CaiB/BaiF CoA-transferase family protein [Hydrogenophaga sp.]NIM43830.1 CoA transferase [Hydrogenophaga sp.]NIN28896.1 CoA transferase [Hydrogenophaga sp.]NIN33355.1 CoA transferase [Hydrogenophaga sp.]NIN58030.1 CoA transferase [Hydrogenophaga sp.]NIO54328.1 CoA transferase [Hydrogenophaga sp.]